MITSPNALGTLTGLQDSLARLGGFGAFGDLHVDRQSILNGWLELAIMDVAKARNWTFHRVDDVALAVHGLYSAGTIAVNAGATAVTGTGTDWVQTPAIMVQGFSHVHVGTSAGFYLLETLTSDTALVIRPSLGGTTNVTAGTYTIGTPDYELAADVWMLLAVREVHADAGRLTIEPYAQWLARTGGVWQTGRPTHAVLMGGAGDDTGTNFKIRLWPVPDVRGRYLYHYRKVPTWQTTAQHEAPQASDVVIFKALELQADAAGNHEAAQRWEAKYLRSLEASAKMDATRAGVVRVRMAPQWGGGRRTTRLDVSETITDP